MNGWGLVKSFELTLFSAYPLALLPDLPVCALPSRYVRDASDGSGAQEAGPSFGTSRPEDAGGKPRAALTRSGTLMKFIAARAQG
jgi:hypothetical protein